MPAFSYWGTFSIIESFMDKEVTKTEAQSICGSVGMALPLITNSFGESDIFAIRNRSKIKNINDRVKNGFWTLSPGSVLKTDEKWNEANLD